jgi:hypothetical protein
MKVKVLLLMYVLGGCLPSLFPFSVVISLADPLAAGQVTEAQHGHSATGGNEMQKNSIKKQKI